MAVSRDETVYIIILNWQTWQETIACLESVLKLDYDDFRVVICDNNSGNDSIAMLTAWLKGEPVVDFSGDARADLIMPYVPKPLKYRLLTEPQLETAVHTDDCLTIVRNNDNYGYAGGNNVGIRYALGDPACAAIWLLNNDVVVTRTALRHLAPLLSAPCGLAGVRVLDYDSGDLQLAGGSSYNCYTGKSTALNPEDASRGRLDYISGCAMMMSRQLLLDVGPLCDEYFLYYEEIDLATRAKAQGYKLAYADDSVVYHQLGATIGTSPLADFYIIRGRLNFTAKFFPRQYPYVLLSVFGTVCFRLLKGQWTRAKMMMSLMLNPGLCYEPARWES